MDIQLYTLVNSKGVKVILSNYGARLVSLTTPDANGIMRDVVLGYDNIDDVVKGNQYFGSTIGRFANRIAGGKFNIDGIEYTLNKNNGDNALHGGGDGYDTTVWTGLQVENKVTFQHTDNDMHQGFPGNVDVQVSFELTDNNELKISYGAETDKATPFNITNHAFFNLRGAGNGNILNHRLLINANKFTPINKNQVPTGDIVEVKGTPFDFTKSTEIGKNIDAENEVLEYGFGYDHNWVINGNGNEMKFCAEVVEPEFGIIMKVYTTEPGVQLYTANFLGDDEVGREGIGYGSRGAFCLETQHYPDSPNKNTFPNTIIRPGEKFFSQTIYKFDTILDFG